MPYDTLPKTVWSFSILVDVCGRIEEFRGQVTECLGASPRTLADRSILDLVFPEDRGTFLRHFGQLGSADLPPPFVARMIGPEKKPGEYAIRFEKGQSLRSAWLLFNQAPAEDGSAAFADEALLFQDEEQLLNLIQMAAKQETASLDVTLIGVGALKDKSARDQLAPGRGEEFEQAVDRTILEGAEMGLAAKASAGRYSVVHDRARPPASLEEEIREAAARFGVADADLGLKSVTVQVSARTSVAELRAQFRGAYQSLGEDFEVEEDRSVLVNRLGLLAIGLASIGIGAGIGAYLAS